MRKLPAQLMKTPETYIDRHGNIVCALHMDASVMNKNNLCDECLDDAQEAEILARPNNRRNK